MEKICTKFAADERFKEESSALGVQSIDPTNLVLRVKGLAESSMQWGCERDMWKRIMNKTLR